jgi:hypothetical protein
MRVEALKGFGDAIQQFTSNEALDGAKKRNVRNVKLSPRNPVSRKGVGDGGSTG